ncbi:MAG: 50S ribosomal protein L11 methyltransferase [Clostridia bacterium]|nr:50S ribosomal protein L11 methyltransferase [Clostridia bacterium]
MQFEELTIHTNSLGAEFVGGVLVAAGISCYVTEDFRDLQDVIDEKSIPYDYIEDELMTDPGETRIKAYLPCNEQGRLQKDEILEGLRRLKESEDFDLGSLTVTLSTVDEEDWADNWKQYFHPLEIGNRFTVKPTWEPYADPDRIVLEIDPASSFGTGQHETTALCLEELETEDLNGKDLLDMGCGSGILGIGAALLGAGRVVGVDIEQTAADTAAENARINGIPERVLNTYCGNVLSDEDLRNDVLKPDSYDYIVANIVADIILAMLPLFRSSLRKGGKLICSGILSSRLESVEAGLKANGFRVLSAREKNDWAVVTAVKPDDGGMS